MEQKIQELIDISRHYGTNKEYVIAGGGNTSYKNDASLWIKASGVALASIDENGFVKMSREKLQVITQKQYSNDAAQREVEVKDDMLAAVLTGNGLRPSVETSLHEIINYPFVVHTHPTLVNALLCSKMAREKSLGLLGNHLMFLPYIDPGYILFKKIADNLKAFREEKGRDPNIILLENHGIFVSSHSVEEVKKIYAEIEMKIRHATPSDEPSTETSKFDSPMVEQAANIFGANMVVESLSNPLIGLFVKNKDAFGMVQTAFTPDHIVYCKARYLFVEEGDDLGAKVDAFKALYGYMPKIIGVKGKGLIVADDSVEAVSIIKDLIQNMMKISWYAEAFGGAKPMTDGQIAFIESWEAENYRKKMAGKK
jgi:rhamnose utilization protein RhaD (predicted bifunctional aldolase and dehydrogenase)